MHHHEHHRGQRATWLRAGVLGANDGLISTSSLILGMSAANASAHAVILTGLAGLVAGALSMAAGEYVSVSSQADAERADTEKERIELQAQPESELLELTTIYEKRGLDRALAQQVARGLMAHDSLAAHLRDELGIHEATRARPLLAASASAVSFIIGALPPLLLAVLWRDASLALVVSATTLVVLGALGAVAAGLGGAPLFRGATRVLVWGSIAMLATYGIGALFAASPMG
ncbi:VIT1/CCC1 transporter family protein [Xanthomonas arboricola]